VGAILFAGGRAAATVVLLVRTLRERLRPDAPLLRRQLGYALPFELYVLVAIAQGSYHQYAIAHQFDAAAFAIYSVGCLALPLVDLVGTSAGNVLMVQMGEAIRDGRPGEAAGLWRETVRKLALLLLPLAGLLVVNARDIIELLFTSAYASSVPIFMLCALVLFPLAVPIDSGLRVFAETRTLFVLHLVTLLTVAASLPWLLSWLGIAGGIVSVALSAAVAKGIGLARLGRLMRVPATRVLPWQAIGAVTAVAAAACVPALVTGRALPFPPFIRAAAVSLVYAAAFGAGCAVLRIFRADEIAAARAWIRHLVAAVHLTRATSEGG
jgi:O-antigen/teichoic acid export membrane protein